MSWSWENVIRQNRRGLAKVVAGMFVLAGWESDDEQPTFLKRGVRKELARLLTVTEAALRRLIVIYATIHKIDGAKTAKMKRPLPDFSSFNKGSGDRKPLFKLIDPRRPLRLPDEAEWYGGKTGSPSPRIWTLEEPRPMVGDCLKHGREEDVAGHFPSSMTAEADAAAQNHQDEPGAADATRLLRRLKILGHALRTLPRQARRMVRMTGNKGPTPANRKPIRPVRSGIPPGHRPKPVHEADHILRECHGLVCDLPGGWP